ncbi:hypothetical protein RCL_jg10388.t1 [Rhizophagus clarus]|uniref:Uncharacterized protein n=1 Tax=Rhizophagus clarus TaxID=94130 RepID=A0A8H3QDC0_9GLOM|nr:hypothetical protein RCL_jg10388.t1 [Rhizophagus clarus]
MVNPTKQNSLVATWVAYRLSFIFIEIANTLHMRKRASIAALWRSLQYLGITRKKLQKAALERNEIC